MHAAAALRAVADASAEALQKQTPCLKVSESPRKLNHVANSRTSSREGIAERVLRKRIALRVLCSGSDKGRGKKLVMIQVPLQAGIRRVALN
jgi:hypothetical protein